LWRRFRSMNDGVTAIMFIGTLGPVRARLTSAQKWVVTSKGAGDHRMPGKGPKGRNHRDPGGSAQDVKGESCTARTPAMDSDVETAAAMVEAAGRDKAGGHIGSGDTLDAPLQQSRSTPGQGEKWRTEHPIHVVSPICVTTGSSVAGPLRCPVWRQSRYSSQTPGVMPRTAAKADGHGYKRAGDRCENPAAQVKDGSILRGQMSGRWVC
jgi:hypothetical protein